MRHLRSALAALAVIVGLPSFSAADVIAVPADHATIQAAIDAAQDGDQIVVAPGTYNEVVNFVGKAITLRSSEGADVTIIDGAGLNDSVVKCISGEELDTVLRGFTITGGTGDPTVVKGFTFGGGMRNNNSRPTVDRCKFVANSVSASGGGMFNQGNSHPIVSNTTFSGNTASGGGGISNDINSSSKLTAINCVFWGNTATGSSGGAILPSLGKLTIVNCTFWGNVAAADGGGIFVGLNNAVTIINSIFWQNSDGDNDTDEFAQIWDLQHRAVVIYTCIQNLLSPGENGNTDANPQFVDPENGDLHLSLASSACIDRGISVAVDLDLDGNLRIVDGQGTGGVGFPTIIDMGAYEFGSYPTCPTDLNDDGAVGAFDLALLLGSWGDCP